MPDHTPHTWKVDRAEPYEEVHPRTGWPVGWAVIERRTCPCGCVGMRDARIRARSAGEAMKQYRAIHNTTEELTHA